MMRAAWCILIAATAAACSSDGGSGPGVDPDAIPHAELAAVQQTLNTALGQDDLYPVLSGLVFPFVDRASRTGHGPGDTTRLVGVELDIQVENESGDPLDAQFTAVLGWRGYRPESGTVDTVFFVLGAGRAPIDVSLEGAFSPDESGTGTAIVAHQATDGAVTWWQTGMGQLVTTSSSFGAATSQPLGELTLSIARGTLAGQFDITVAHEVPDSATQVATARSFTVGAPAIEIAMRGVFNFALARARDSTR